MWLEILLPALVGGCFAGAIALVVGGVGGMLQTRRAVTGLADIVGDLQVQVQKEIKRRAGEAGLAARGVGKVDPLVESLATGASAARQNDSTDPSGPEIMRRARSMGLVR